MSGESWFSGEPDLAVWEREIWRRLEASVGDRNSGWRLPVLGTCSATGVRQRVVVLRGATPKSRTVLAHTDARSAKVAEISRQPAVSLLFYDAANQVQVQLTGAARIHFDDDVANSLWESETEASLRGYLGPLAPGVRCSHPETNLPDSVGKHLRRGELSGARRNFVVISCEVERAELVVLRRSGNLRALFDYTSNEIEASWLAP